jgi:hypothetical protein
MILRQPIPQRRRHQQQLTTVNRDEISCHPKIVLNPADGTKFRQPLAEALICSRAAWETKGIVGSALSAGWAIASPF